MYIREIKCISNYRNLSGISLQFDEDVNYLIGENNIGKTNILELLHCFFSIGKFSASDFTDVTKPIEICVRIEYSDDEIGFFEDCFDIENNNTISIRGVQKDIDDRITYSHDTPCQPVIPATSIKKMTVLYYYAQRLPAKETDFRRTNGSAKVLNYLVQQSMQARGVGEQDVINAQAINGIIQTINEHISKLNTITGDSISAYYDNEPNKVLCRVLGLGDSNGRDLSTLGEGIQYAFNIVLQIIETIYNVKATHKADYFQARLISVQGKRLFPLFLILDEPEIHQHPYRQRSIIKKITDIMHNKNEEFCKLLFQLFDIDGLTGQVFIATHSPNIISNNYKQFIRLTKQGENLYTFCGYNIDLESVQLYKHMLHCFPYFKEAMFSKAVLFVEGDTENGAMPVFATRKSFDIDDLGIGIVKMDGGDNVLPYMNLFSSFGIKAKAILDADKRSDYQDKPDIFFTNGDDFEEDIYDSFKLCDFVPCMKELGMETYYIGVFKRNGIPFNPSDFLASIDWGKITDDIQAGIMTMEKTNRLVALRKSKNAVKGSILAEFVTEIPQVYSLVLDQLVKGI